MTTHQAVCPICSSPLTPEHDLFKHLWAKHYGAVITTIVIAWCISLAVFR